MTGPRYRGIQKSRSHRLEGCLQALAAQNTAAIAVRSDRVEKVRAYRAG